MEKELIIEKIQNGTQLVIKLSGRLDTITAPDLEAELKEIVYELDPHAFFIVQEGVRIEGNFIRRIS